jgi:prepilin-type N-terminal cleavage/methylation domain-containing protein
MTRSVTKRQGFTLVELLVVIAIIGILAALVVPGLLRTQRRAQQTVCSNHLKGLYTAALDYSLTSNFFPVARGNSPLAHESLNVLVNSSAGEDLKPETFFCPEGEAQEPLADADGNFTLAEDTLSYTWVAKRTRKTGKAKPLSSDKYIGGVEYSDGEHYGHENTMILVYTDGAVKSLDVKKPEERAVLNADFLPEGLTR